MTHAAGLWRDALSAATLLVVDPAGLGGVHLRAPAGSVRDAWISHLRDALPNGCPLRKMPPGIADGPLLGGLDLAATLQSGRPIVARGLLAEADGGVVLLAMAERISAATAARLAAALDAGCVATARDGVVISHPTRCGMIALDEGLDDDEHPPTALTDRMAFQLNLSSLPPRNAVNREPADINAARFRLPDVIVPDGVVHALAQTAEALGVPSVRSLLFAIRATAAAAAVAGRNVAEQSDAILAGRLVLAPRATCLPDMPQQDAAEVQPTPQEADASELPPPAPSSDEVEGRDDTVAEAGELAEQVLAAIATSIPSGLLARLRAEVASRVAAKSTGRVGDLRATKKRGRPAGVRRGHPREGLRLNVLETLRAAAPWQRLRCCDSKGPRRIEVRADDFRVARSKARSETCTIFVVDASGSQALNRLAEAKGAVERLLADCYVRRDRVAVLGFRGKAAEMLLPPTRSLVRAKRSLSGLPGGGGTPLAAGIDAAASLADTLRRRGEVPTVVFLTDGQGNVGRDGTGGRAKAEIDARAAAAGFRSLGVAALLIDTAPRSRPQARMIADAMHASYLALPFADPTLISRAVQAASRP